jgi:hypothetical protein
VLPQLEKIAQQQVLVLPQHVVDQQQRVQAVPLQVEIIQSSFFSIK